MTLGIIMIAIGLLLILVKLANWIDQLRMRVEKLENHDA